jgi:hypothetical protein
MTHQRRFLATLRSKPMRTPILRSSSYRQRISYLSFSQGIAGLQARVYAFGGLSKGSTFSGAERFDG